jgi:hypothetical protein
MKKEQLRQYVNRFKEFVSLPVDSEDLKSRKALVVLISYIVSTVTLLSGAIYLYLENFEASGILLVFTTLTYLNLLFLYVTKRFFVFSLIEFGLFLLTPFALYSLVRESNNASVILIWALLAPLCSFVAHGYKHAIVWFADYLVLLFALIYLIHDC